MSVIAEPSCGGLATVLGLQALAFPDAHGAERGASLRQGFGRQGRIGRGWNTDAAGAAGGKSERAGGEPGLDEGHAWQGALGQEFSRRVDQEEAPVADKAQRIEFRRRHGIAAAGFDGVEEQAGDMHAKDNESRGGRQGKTCLPARAAQLTIL